MSGYCLGLDWGGTRVKIGAVTWDGTLIKNDIVHLAPGLAIDDSMQRLFVPCEKLIQEMGQPPEGIGLALTGPVDPTQGVVHLPGKVLGLAGYPVVAAFKKRFGVPVRAGNDGELALRAERAFGQLRGIQWAVMLTIGTGVGSGVILGGKILRDPNFLFGAQVGHLVIDCSQDQLCLTGARGTGELLCSATALVLGVTSGLKRGIPSILAGRFLEDPASINFQNIMEIGVSGGDRLCLDELHRWTRHLGWLLVSASHAYSPEVIMLAGGACAASDHFIPALQTHVNSHTFRYPPNRQIPICASRLGDHIGVLGAAAMMQEKIYD